METGNTSPSLSFSPPSVSPLVLFPPPLDVHLQIIRCKMLSIAIMSPVMVIAVSYVLWFTGKHGVGIAIVYF